MPEISIWGGFFCLDVSTAISLKFSGGVMLSTLGFLIFLVGWIWIIVTAITTGKTGGEKALWAIVNIFCQPVTGIIFVIVRKKGMVPLILIIVGWLLIGAGIATNPELLREIFKALR
jgi:hypothetical protein